MNYYKMLLEALKKEGIEYEEYVAQVSKESPGHRLEFIQSGTVEVKGEIIELIVYRLIENTKS